MVGGRVPLVPACLGLSTSSFSTRSPVSQHIPSPHPRQTRTVGRRTSIQSNRPLLALKDRREVSLRGETTRYQVPVSYHITSDPGAGLWKTKIKTLVPRSDSKTRAWPQGNRNDCV